MKSLISAATAVVLIACISSTVSVDLHPHNKIVCFWNSTSFERNGPAKFQEEHFAPALSMCTHLVYGFAGIDQNTFEVKSLNPNLDTGAGYAFYRVVTQLKRRFPGLKIFLSIGGNADPFEEPYKYLVLTETQGAREKFIRSLLRHINDYDFDGFDLAWQFPPKKVKKDRGTFGGFWHKLKKVTGFGAFKDDKEELHRDGFTNLTRELMSQLRPKGKNLTLTVLPHVNASVYYDVRNIQDNLDAVHVFAFDQVNPERTPKKADVPAPIYSRYGREESENVVALIRYWQDNGFRSDKIVLGVPTFARAWKLDKDSETVGEPPVTAVGALDDSVDYLKPQAQIPGVLSYAEVCTLLLEHTRGHSFRQTKDPSKRFGAFAVRPYNKDSGLPGVWIGYEDPDMVQAKALYARNNNLGGLAIYDLSLDDFRGVCSGDKFPIVKAAKINL